MEICGHNAHTGTDGVNRHSGKSEGTGAIQIERIAAATVTKKDGDAETAEGNLGRTAAFYPGFDGEVLKLQADRIAQRNSIAAAIQHQRRPHPANPIGRTAEERSI